MRQRLKDFSILNATVIAFWLFITALHIIKNDAACTFMCKDFSDCSFSALNCFWKAAVPSLYALVIANLGWIAMMLFKQLRKRV
ncbi:hypothetical protein JXA12_03640 [Candidatus Woesearchaeota archaeon]|nr:hypothetical protein [Candidatus Woesearchaeota archaeon]